MENLQANLWLRSCVTSTSELCQERKIFYTSARINQFNSISSSAEMTVNYLHRIILHRFLNTTLKFMRWQPFITNTIEVKRSEGRSTACGSCQGVVRIVGTLLSVSCQVSAKFGNCTVVSLYRRLVEAKMFTVTLECTHFIFNKCPISTTGQMPNLALVETKRITAVWKTEEKPAKLLKATFGLWLCLACHLSWLNPKNFDTVAKFIAPKWGIQLTTA
jgi:hypothetical protein